MAVAVYIPYAQWCSAPVGNTVTLPVDEVCAADIGHQQTYDDVSSAHSCDRFPATIFDQNPWVIPEGGISDMRDIRRHSLYAALARLIVIVDGPLNGVLRRA